ncbi:MAG: glutamine-hydrolyzing carbamoyl-phosphate synthase small subunit [Candidatus Nitrohelix vancouverensis]|uniref:Carbamoyl phosphate synthase small chain n=1 Tax=Candidatus Nitrohelix vancouverensis TaxID=2705534 RepID=A0A7T0G447_9BACT|nr:MAG: glutamine-hydrolyzing carbamoyl-phosphate synthase small subunit [Candidatus Nitrohelix vancouverensis]
MKATLVLADGRSFSGESFGAEGESIGEIVFNTSMFGYQEILTDPSYCGQIVVMTYPLIGNYGINPEDNESDKPHLKGFIVKELSGIPSNWRSTQTLDEFLKQHQIIGIQGIDTRALTRHIRDNGAQQAVLSTLTDDIESLRAKAQSEPPMEGRDMVREVTCKSPYDWAVGEWEMAEGRIRLKPESTNGASKDRFSVVAYDFGIKQNILRKLVQSGCRVKVVPANTPAQEVLDMKPDGIFLSNGPGDPDAVAYAVDTVKQLLGKAPIFAICLGHQILSLALGAKTFKLRFGHHGGNQPVIDLATRKVEITSQNHGFSVDAQSVGGGFESASLNLNDQTVEGIRHKEMSILSVQYHPEASPGPHDSDHLFQEFIEMMKAR